MLNELLQVDLEELAYDEEAQVTDQGGSWLRGVEVRPRRLSPRSKVALSVVKK